MYKVAIVGSRRFSDYETFCKVLDPILPKIALVVSGGARGADSMAERYAKEHGIVLLVYPADWKKYGKRAGFRRNVVIANVADKMVAFVDKESRGTRHAIKKMQQLKKPVVVIDLDELRRRTAGPDKEE